MTLQVKSCDKIIVVQDGRVVEEGSHTELLEREQGVYRSMWQRQSSEDQSPTRWAGMTVDDSNGNSSDEEGVIPGVSLGTRAALE